MHKPRSGVQGQSPGGSLGVCPQKLETNMDVDSTTTQIKMQNVTSFM